jgi:hypothetical protein
LRESPTLTLKSAAEVSKDALSDAIADGDCEVAEKTILS